jgi:multidrug efflux system membrane fusion protein
VTVARVIDGRSVITQGIEAGEQVVIDGQLRLTNGSRIEVRQPGAAKPGSGS